MEIFSGKKKIFVLIIIILVLVCLNLFEKNIKNFFYLLSEPLQNVFFQTGQRSSGFLQFLSKIRNLEKENNALLIENQELKSRITSLKELQKENKVLRQALELNLQKDFSLLFCSITSIDLAQDLILIDKGIKHGLFTGQVVINSQKALVGKIEQAYDDFSKVALISSPKNTFPVKSQEGEFGGVAKGLGNFELFVDLIPQDAQIIQGEQIVTVSLDGAFPKGLLVGEVKDVQKLDLAPYQKVIIKPSFDLKQIEFVFVIL